MGEAEQRLDRLREELENAHSAMEREHNSAQQDRDVYKQEIASLRKDLYQKEMELRQQLDSAARKELERELELAKEHLSSNSSTPDRESGLLMFKKPPLPADEEQ